MRRTFYEVLDWEAFQYSDRRKVPNPPWRWFRIQVAMLRAPQWLALSAAQRADFIALLGAASETGNLIPDDPAWLGVRGLNRQSLRQLVNKSLAARVSLPSDHPRIKELRRVLSGAAPDPEGRGQRTEDRYQKGEGNRSSSVRDPLLAATQQRPFQKDDAHMPGPPRPGHDPRPFDEIKSLVLEIWCRFPGKSPAELHKLGGCSKRISPQQVAVAYRQLRDEGRLPPPRSTGTDPEPPV
jgi:hypothetical protein